MSSHSERAHALLSASGAKRWLACPPSARLEEKFPESTSSFAEEGTLAHELAELELTYLLNPDMDQKQLDKARAKIAKHERFTSEMPGQVAKYVDYVWEAYSAELLISGDHVELKLEEKYDLTTWVPESFGTGDAGIVGGKTLRIMDLKYGKGVRVEAEDNPQLILYALGAYDLYSMFYEIEEVEMVIVQPRLDNISVSRMTVKALLERGELIKKYADLAFKGEGNMFAGDHCMFCKAGASCRARAKKNLEMMKHDFADPELLEDHEMVDIFGRAAELAKWAEAVKKYMTTQAMSGKKWDGLKVVEGRSNRAWLDESEAIKRLKREGLKPSEVVKSKIKGIVEIENKLKKLEKASVISELTHKPPGKPALVDVSDKRPPYDANAAAQDVFDDEFKN